MLRNAYDNRLPFHRRNLPAGAGARLKQARIEAGRSRKDVAAAAGVVMRTLARIERGDQTPQWPTLKRLCEVLGINDRSIALRWSQDEGNALTDPGIVPGLGLRALRRQRGMTLEKLADDTGISISTFSRFERGLIASRALTKASGSQEEWRVVLESKRVAKAFGFSRSEQLREACLKAGRNGGDESGV